MTTAETRYALRGEVERVLGDVDKIEKPRPTVCRCGTATRWRRGQ